MKSLLKIVRVSFVVATLVLWIATIVLNYVKYWKQQPLEGIFCFCLPESYGSMLAQCPLYWLCIVLTVATALLETALLVRHEQRIRGYLIEVSIVLIPLLITSALSTLLTREPQVGRWY